MGVYSRFKRNPDGFRALVELLETTPASKRQKMIEVGMQEDAEYTERALKYVMTFEDILTLSDPELAEVLAKAPPKMSAYSVSLAPEETKTRFLKNAIPRIMAEIKDCMLEKIGPREVGGAQLKLVETARKLEKQGYVKAKKIPT
jgi:flagellar motor switch protein FliG